MRGDDKQRAVHVLRREEKRNLTDVKQQRVSEGVRVSLFPGLSLAEYVLVKKHLCENAHKECKQGCKKMVERGK